LTYGWTYNRAVSTAERIPGRLYDRDFYEWTATTAQLLRAGRLSEVDAEAVAEEIEDMGKRDKHAVQSLISTITGHLLKIGYASATAEAIRSWEDEVDEFRLQLDRKLEDSPSLRRIVAEEIPRSYRHARRRFLRHESSATIPEFCPYSAEQILDEDFFPAR
jgi:Domain of unknown function DUF29